MQDGRLVFEYEPWLTKEMLVKPFDITPDVFTEMIMNHLKVYVIEDEEGPLALSAFLAPKGHNVILGEALWIRPEARGGTFLISRLIKESLQISGRDLLVAHAIPHLLESKRDNGFIVELPVLVEKVYTHKGVYIHAAN